MFFFTLAAKTLFFAVMLVFFLEALAAFVGAALVISEPQLALGLIVVYSLYQHFKDSRART